MYFNDNLHYGTIHDFHSFTHNFCKRFSSSLIGSSLVDQFLKFNEFFSNPYRSTVFYSCWMNPRRFFIEHFLIGMFFDRSVLVISRSMSILSFLIVQSICFFYFTWYFYQFMKTLVVIINMVELRKRAAWHFLDNDQNYM